MKPDSTPPDGDAPAPLEMRLPPGWMAGALADWATRWPAVFKRPTPLAIGVSRQIHAELNAALTRKAIHVALHHWTTRRAYLAALARGDVRRNLDGSEAGAPDEGARELARRALAALPPRDRAPERDAAPRKQKSRAPDR